MTQNDPGDTILLALVRRLVLDGTARRIRKDAHLSLGDVGRALGGVAPSTVMRWERGALPRRATAIRYGALLTQLSDLEAR